MKSLVLLVCLSAATICGWAREVRGAVFDVDATLADESVKRSARFFAAIKLDWLDRCERKVPIELSCLKVGRARVLHMPGELFVEYQLNAQKLRPDLFVAMAAYGDYSAGYIGTEIAYAEGGYETSPGRPKTSAKVEGVLMGAVKELLSRLDSMKRQ